MSDFNTETNWPHSLSEAARIRVINPASNQRRSSSIEAWTAGTRSSLKPTARLTGLRSRPASRRFSQGYDYAMLPCKYCGATELEDEDESREVCASLMVGAFLQCCGLGEVLDSFDLVARTRTSPSVVPTPRPARTTTE